MENNLPLGLVPGMLNEVYHSHHAIGASGLKCFMQSPAHYWANYLDPGRVEKDAKHFRIGRAWHCAVFEPASFDDRFAVNHDAHPATKRAQLLQKYLAMPAKDHPITAAGAELVALPEGLSLTSKEGKALVAEIEADGKVPTSAEDRAFVFDWLPKLHGRDVLSADHIKAVKRMAAIALNLPISRVVFERFGQYGAAEQSLFWTHPGTGVMLKIRPDYMLTPCSAFPDGLIIDGKSTTDASAEGFARSVWNLDYGMQAALYPMVYQAVFKTSKRPAFLWLAQEKESPFAARYYSAGDDLIEHYTCKIESMLPRVAGCQRTNTWPAYPETVSTLSMPAYAQKAMEVAA